MLELNEQCLRRNLDALALDQLARQTGIENSYTKKIHGPMLLTSLLWLINQRQCSLNAWASLYSALAHQSVSKQALSLKFDQRHAAFFEAALQRQLTRSLLPDEGADEGADEGVANLFSAFRRVLVEDSTCFKLPDHLHEHFPAGYAGGADQAMMRLQWLHDLKHERLVAFDLQSYCDNDQKHAPAVLAHLAPGDLLLRDLGYFATAVFAQIDQRQGFYLSRLHFRTHVFEPGRGTRLDLVKLIGDYADDCLDLEVHLGVARRLPVRLVGVRLPEDVASARRRRARKAACKDKRRGYSKAYATWLGWSFFVTNVPAALLNRHQILRLYRLRWRIEMIFKGLKAVLQVGSLFVVRGLSRQRLRIHLLGVLLYAALVVWPYYRLLGALLLRQGYQLSLMKLLQWLGHHLVWVLQISSVASVAAQVGRHCAYERRQKRKNYRELCSST